MLNFNSGGYLIPNRAVESNVTELEKEFVIEYSSVERSKLFETYKQYSNDLKKLCGGIELLQWIDGSFVTKRKPRPSDIDMVTFVPIELVSVLKGSIERFAYPMSKENYPGIDAYIVEIHKPGSKSFTLYQSDILYWQRQFDTTRRNRTGKKLPKGFLEVKY